MLSCIMCGCDTASGNEETTDMNEDIIAAIDRSAPITTGNLITKTSTDTDGNINICYYDNNDNLVEKYVWDEDSEVSHVIMSYSATAKLITKEDISPDGQTNTVYSYKYDSDDTLSQTTVSEFEDGFLAKSTTYDSEENVTGYSLYFYNDTKGLSKIEIYDEGDTLLEYFMYEYDANGNKVKYSAFSADGNLEQYTTFEYNDASLLVKEKYFNSANELQNYSIYEYYDSGSMKTAAKYDSDGNEISKDYFDDTAL